MKKALGNEDSGAVPFRALRAVFQDQKTTFTKISGVMCPENLLIAIIVAGRPFSLSLCTGISPDRVLLDKKVKALLYSRPEEEVLINSTSRLLRLISSSTMQTVAFTAGGIFLGIPFVFLVYLWPTPIPALLFLIIPTIFGHMYLGPVMAMLLGIAGARRRALASATYGLVINLLANKTLREDLAAADEG